MSQLSYLRGASSVGARRGMVVFSALLVVVLQGCAPPPPPPPTIVPEVTVAHPARREVIEWDDYSGHLEAVDFVEVRARVSGLVMSAPFQPGAIVKQGDLLVEIDVRPFQADLDSRVAEEARAAAQVSIAELELKRIEDMPTEASVPIERQRVEAALSEAKAIRAGAKAAVDSARLLVEWCRVTAPISGRISSRYVDPGNLISGGGGTGTLLTTIASIDPIHCWIDADERAVLKYQRLAKEKKRATAREVQIPFYMQLADESDFLHQGMVDFVDNRIDLKTGTIRGRGVLSNPDGWFTPGFFARVRIPGSGAYETILVPDLAVVTDQNQKALYVVGGGDKVELRPVKLGRQFGDLRAIESGVDENDRVIINGLMQVRPGVQVKTLVGSFSIASLPAVPTGVIPPRVDAAAPATSTESPR